MKKLYSLFLVFLFSLSFHAISQTGVTFAYDAAGNRVKREIVMSRSMPSASPDDNEKNSFFDALGSRTVRLTGIAYGILKIEILGYESSDDAFAEVYSLGGIMITSQPVADAIAEINISDSPSGTYILKVSVNGKSTVWKIAKR